MPGSPDPQAENPGPRAPVSEGDAAGVSFRADLSGLSDYDVIEAIATETARIAAAEAARLVAIAELASRPCMQPEDPEVRISASGRKWRPRV